jgi:DNA-binding NarL/FixJ family response regulator
MNTIARECLYRRALGRLLDEMNLEHSEHGLWVSEQYFIPIFIFPDDSAYALYNDIRTRIIRSPALVFCPEHMIPFLQDIYFKERLYFISLNTDCVTVKREIRAMVRRYPKFKPSSALTVSPYLRLSEKEADVVKYLVQGYKQSTISLINNMPVRHISLYKQSAMRKLKVNNFPELYFKVRLLDRSL